MMRQIGRNKFSFSHGLASARLVVEDDFGVITNLYSHSRGYGEATKVMQEIVEYADQRNLALTLVAQRFGNHRMAGLDNQLLRIFYEKFGFTTTDIRRSYYMTRSPKVESHQKPVL